MKQIIIAAVSLLVASASLADTVINEKFAANPLTNGWQIYGDASLFQWNPAAQAMDVTWDSTQTNSFFYHPLGRVFTQTDGFCVQFDLNLTDTDTTGYFQLAIGLCNFAGATGPNFSRANGECPNLCEFDYYPGGPGSYGPSLDATLVDATNQFYFCYDTTQSLATNTDYRVVLIHPPGAATVSATIYTNGRVFSRLPSVYAGQATNGFSLDTLAICNYTTRDDVYGDSLLAHGTVGNLSFASPLPLVDVQAVGVGQIQFASDTNWLYTLEQSADFQTWTPAAPAVPGTGASLVLQATNPPAAQAFYRVRADLP